MPEIPPPPPVIIAPAITAAPGYHELTHTKLQTSGNCAVLAHSHERVGRLSAPILIRMHDCRLQAENSPVFIISNAQAEIRLTDCHAGHKGSLLLHAQESVWGQPGFNSASVRISTANCTLTGDIYVGPNCKVELTLGPSSVWTGTFTGPGSASLHRHASATWNTPSHTFSEKM